MTRILIMGCGGIGGYVAARLIETGHDVTAVTHNPAITEAVNANGFEVREERAGRRIAGRAFTDIPTEAAPFDFVLLATQPPQVVEAARAALPYLPAHGAMVCFQNGLCEERVADVAGEERTIGAVVAWGGSMLRPGVYDRTSAGGFAIGRMDGSVDARLDLLRGLLEPIGPVDITRNLGGARWSKLAINCAISSLGTIGGERLGRLIRYRFARRLALEVMTEVVAVAQRLDMRLEKVSGTIDLDWIALGPNDLTGPGSPSLMAKHALLLAVGAKYRRLRSSMLAAIERGREPAVDYLNGEVTSRAAAFGIPVPLNERIRETVHAIARRELQPSVRLLRMLYIDSRAPVSRAITGYGLGDAARRSRAA